MIKYPKQVKYEKFAHDCTSLEVRYGLPSEITFCKKCVISNQRPNSVIEYKHHSDSYKKTICFNKNDVCDACLVAEKKNNQIDWVEREEQLIELCKQHRKNDGSYDCLLPGSGGKDSFFAAHILKYKYGMNPLTVTWAPHIYTDWGWKNHQRWIQAGFDNILVTPNGLVHRLLTRLAMDNILHPFQPFMIGQKAIAPNVAQQYDIKLIFYGENEAEYGNPIADIESPERSSDYFATGADEDILLSGVSIKNLVSDFGLSYNDLKLYMPSDVNKIKESGTIVHYLGYYLKWHPQSCYYYSVEHGGFEPAPERTVGTYSKYNSIDDKIDDLHYYTTGIKFGLGRASYDAAQEIRSSDITREEGISLVQKYDHEYPSRFFNEILPYLSINSDQFPIAHKQFEQGTFDEKYFNDLCNSFRSPHLWVYCDNEWKLRHPIFKKAEVVA